MTAPSLEIRGFSHVCVGVSDLERSLAFYRDGLGLRVIFDVELAGPGMESVTGEAGARGRMVGCLVPGGVTIELLGFAHRARPAPRPRPATGHTNVSPSRPATGYTNVSLSVSDLDAAYAALEARGVRPLQRPVEVGGVRMFFVADPDGTPIEIIEFPGGALSSAEHNGVRR
jgi:glyoxylase I family protein